MRRRILGPHRKQRANGASGLPLVLAALASACADPSAGGGEGSPNEAMPTFAAQIWEDRAVLEARSLSTSREFATIEELFPAPAGVNKANGTIVFDSTCTSDHRSKLTQAMTIARSAMTSGTLSRCLSQGFLGYADGADPEWISRLLALDLPTQIACTGQGGGATEEEDTGVIDHERIKISPSILDGSATIAFIAGTIAHEVSHTKGWRHPYQNQNGWEEDFTVPYVVTHCVESIGLGEVYPYQPHPTFDTRTGRKATDVNRSRMPDEMTMAQVGISMRVNQVVDGRCTSGFSRALAVGGPEPHPKGVAIDCESGDVLGLGTFPVAAWASCGADELLIGVTGNDDGFAASILGICAKRSVVTAGQQTGIRTIFPQPASKPLNYLRLCPPGMAINGLSGHASNAVLADFSMHCESVSGSPTRAERRHQVTVGVRPSSGTSGASLEVIKCAGRAPLKGLLGATQTSTGTLLSLGGLCTNIEALSDRARLRTESFTNLYATPTIGEARGAVAFGATGYTFSTETRCADGQAMIGIDLWTTGRVNMAQPVCANVEQWTNPSAPAPAQSTLLALGTSGGARFTPRCNRGELMDGFQVGTSTRDSDGARTIDTVRPICRDFRRR